MYSKIEKSFLSHKGSNKVYMKVQILFKLIILKKNPLNILVHLGIISKLASCHQKI